MQAALSKTHVGIFFLFLLFVPLQAMKKLNMKKKNGADHAERGFSACVLRAGKKR